MGKSIAPNGLVGLNPAQKNLMIVVTLIDHSGSTSNIGGYTQMGQNLLLDTLQKYNPNTGIYVIQVVFNHDWEVVDDLRHVSQGTMLGLAHLAPTGGTMLFKTVLDVIDQVEAAAEEWRKADPANTATTVYGIFTDADAENTSAQYGISAGDVKRRTEPLVMAEKTTVFYCGMGGANKDQHDQWANDMGIPSNMRFIIDNSITDPVALGREIRHAFGLFSQVPSALGDNNPQQIGS